MNFSYTKTDEALINFEKLCKNELTRVPVLNTYILNSGNPNLYFDERFQMLYKLAGAEKMRIDIVEVFLDDKSKFDSYIPANNCLISPNTKFYSGEHQNLGESTYLIKATFSLEAVRGQYYRFISLHGLAMEKKVSQKYFQTRWTLQIIDGMDAASADRASELL